MIKKIITRVIVAVGVIFCLSFLSQFFPFLNFIINVNAEESTPIRIELDKGNGTLVNKDNVVSNVFTDDTNVISESQIYLFGISPSDSECQNGDDCFLKSSPEPGFYETDMKDNVILPPSEYNDVYVYGGDLQVDFVNNMVIEPGNHYEMIYLICKLNNSIRFIKNSSFTLNSLNVGYSYNGGILNYDISDSVFNLTTEFYVTSSSATEQGNYAYVKIVFDTPDNFYDLFPTDEIYFNSFYLSVNKPEYSTPQPINGLFYYPASNGNKQLSQSFVFVKNGRVYFSGKDCPNGTCHNGMAYSDSFDNVYYDDAEKINSLPVCSDSDIVCHIQRVFQMITNFFVRFGNFLQKFFEDTDSSINDKFHEFFDDFQLENGGLSAVVSAPLNFISSLNTSSCSSINLSIIGYPVVIPCLTSSLYLVYFSELFNIYQVITTGYISYYCLLNMFKIVRGLQNPDSDKVEVLDL